MKQETSGPLGRLDGDQSNSQHAEAVMTVLEESVAVFFRLRAVMEDIHGHSEISGSMRGVMRDLKQHGPLTVPQMARKRPVSRQHIQAIVNDLQRAGLVSLEENPKHKRSRIVKLTPSGVETLNMIIEREHMVLNATSIPVTLDELAQADDILTRLREMMESQDWRDTVRTVLYQNGNVPENYWLDEADEFRDPEPLPPR